MSKNEKNIADFDALDTIEACETPFEVELTHPSTKAPLGVFVSVVGNESPGVKTFIRQSINRDRRRAFEAQRKGRQSEPQTIEEEEAETVKLLSAFVRGWRTVIDGKSEPVIYWKGEKLDFNPDNLNRWLTHFAWVRPQINEAASDLGNYLGN